MGQLIKITDDAYNAIAALRRDGYSIKRLASDAILEKYPAPALPSAERDYALGLLAECGGDKQAARQRIPVGYPGLLKVLQAIEEA